MWWYCILFVLVGVIVGVISGYVSDGSRRMVIRDSLIGVAGAMVGGWLFVWLIRNYAILVGMVGAVTTAIILMLAVKYIELYRK